MRRLVLIVVIFALLTFCLYSPILKNHVLTRLNDLDGNVAQIGYIAHTLRTTGIFPQWNFYLNQGLPTLADPLSGHLNPLMLLSFLIFAPEFAVKVIYFISLLSGTVGVYWFLRKLDVRHSISFMLGSTYLAQGYTIAHIIAGHLEKIVTVGIAPWVLYFIWITAEKKSSRIFEMCTASFITLILFSGDLYGALYLCVLVLGTALIQRNMAFLRILMWIAFLGAAKLVPFIELSQHIGKKIEPFEGSQNFISMMYYFFIPLKQPFQILGFGNFLKTGFAWWEKVAFIGPFILVGIWGGLKDKYSRLFLWWIFVCLLLATPASILNPYHWLLRSVPILELFHVPSRIFGIASIVFLILAGIGFEKLTRRNRLVLALVFLNLSLVIFFHTYVDITRQMPQRQHDREKIKQIQALQSAEIQPFYIAQNADRDPLPQSQLVLSGQKIFNTNYGLQLKNSPAQNYTRFDYSEVPTYTDIKPAYVSTEKGIIQQPHFNYISSSGPSTIQDIQLSPNTISFTVDAPIKTKITVLESSYPGWKLHVDNRLATFSDGRFLVFEAPAGKHTFKLSFYSILGIIGFGISCIAWSVGIGKVWAFLKGKNLPEVV